MLYALLLLLVVSSTITAWVSPRHLTTPPPPPSGALLFARRARDKMQSLIEEEQCFSTEPDVRALGDVCAYNVVLEDRFESQPFVGKAVSRYYESTTCIYTGTSFQN